MTIEQKIDEYLSQNVKYNRDGSLVFEKIGKWTWSPGEISAARFILEKQKVFRMIEEADMVECLTSNSHYIRECKKWMTENKI